MQYYYDYDPQFVSLWNSGKFRRHVKLFRKTNLSTNFFVNYELAFLGRAYSDINM